MPRVGRAGVGVCSYPFGPPLTRIHPLKNARPGDVLEGLGGGHRRPATALRVVLLPPLGTRLRSLLAASAMIFVSVRGSAPARAAAKQPDLESLARGAEPLGRSAVGLESLAAARFKARTIPSAVEAAALWTSVALMEPDRIEPLLEAARARVWLAEHETWGKARREHADAAVATAQACGDRVSGSAACNFWLAAALGVQARERKLTALGTVRRIEALLKRAAASAPLFESGGPDRALALLYARAPAWPLGPGDARLAAEHARRAVALDPGFPPNHLALAEALEDAGGGEGCRQALEEALRLARLDRERGHPDAGEWIAEAERKLARDFGDSNRDFGDSNRNSRSRSPKFRGASEFRLLSPKSEIARLDGLRALK